MKLNRILLCIILPVIGVSLCGCGTADEGHVSENAQTVIFAAMNTPNSDLFTEAMITVIGGDSSLTETEKAEKEAVRIRIESNWEAAVGHCFSPGSMDRFLTSTIATKFYLESFISKGYTKVLSITPVAQDDRRETVNVELDINGDIHTYAVTFRKNTDGLFYSVELQQAGDN